jgi:inositol polyphosphate-4-phosphatase
MSKNGGPYKTAAAAEGIAIKNKCNSARTSKIIMVHDAIQAIHREVVDGMRALMKLAKEKTTGMLTICEDMISKTRSLLSLWDPGLVEEALSFVEEHKVSQPIAEDPVDGDDGLCSFELRHQQALSPHRQIRQQLNFDLKSPDLDEPVTPDSQHCTRIFWRLPANGTVQMSEMK